MDSRIKSFREALNAQPLSRFQIWTLIQALLLLLSDGFDAQAIAFVAPALGGHLHLPRAAFGPVFSAGLLGLMLGAMCFAPLGDRFGTRRPLAFGTLIYAVFTLATIWAMSLEALIVLRFLAGFGLGSIMPNTLSVMSEYAPARLRTAMVTVAACGFPLGGVLGGSISPTLIERFGWQSVFIVGCILPLLTLPLILWTFPKSVLHLLDARSRNPGLRRVAAHEVSGRKASQDAGGYVETASPPFPVRLLFARGLASRTIFLWVAFFMNVMLYYFIVNWLPTVLLTGGLSLKKASMTLALYYACGIVGALVLGILCDLVVPQLVLAVAFFGSAICVLFIGLAGTASSALMASAAGAGFCTIGGQAAMVAFTSAYYPLAARATGVGWALGIGRFGSTIGPLIGGVLIGMNVSVSTLLRLAAIPALITSAVILLVRRCPEQPSSEATESTAYKVPNIS